MAVLAWVRNSESRPSSRKRRWRVSSPAACPTDRRRASAAWRSTTAAAACAVVGVDDIGWSMVSSSMCVIAPVHPRNGSGRRRRLAPCVPGRRWIDPVPLALEGIGRKRHSPSPRVAMQRRPVERQLRRSRAVRLPRAATEVGAPVCAVGKRGDHRPRGCPAAVAARRARSASGPGRLRGTRAVDPRVASRRPSAKRTGSRSWRAQNAGSVACSSVIQSPVRLETKGVCGARPRDLRDDPGEALDDRLHHRRMECVGGGEPPRRQIRGSRALLRQPRSPRVRPRSR